MKSEEEVIKKLEEKRILINSYKNREITLPYTQVEKLIEHKKMLRWVLEMAYEKPERVRRKMGNFQTDSQEVKVLDYLRKNKSATLREISIDLEIKRISLNNVLNTLKKNKKIKVKSGRGVRNDPYIYELNNKK